MKKEEDMSNTFVMEVGQKSAIAEDPLDDVSGFPDIKVDPPEEVSDHLENKKEDSMFSSKFSDKDRKSNQKGPKNIIFIVLLMTLSLGIGIFATYFYLEIYQKEEIQEKKDENASNKTLEEEISPDSLYMKELISNYDDKTISEIEVYRALYSKDKIYVKDLEDSYLRSLTAVKANQNIEKITFSSEQFQNAAAMLFGEQVSFTDRDFSLKDACIEMKYDPNSQVYSSFKQEGCQSSTDYRMERKIVKAMRKKDAIEVNVAVAIIQDSTKTVFRSYDFSLSKNSGIDEIEKVNIDTFDIEKDYSKLNQYQYIFHYDRDNNNYYLVSIELVK